MIISNSRLGDPQYVPPNTWGSVSSPSVSVSAEEQRLKAIGDSVVRAEAELWLSYDRISKLAFAGGVSSKLPTKLLLGYNINRENLIQTSKAWLELRKEEGEAPDLDRAPTYPPKFLLPSRVNSEIQVGHIQVSYGPEGDLTRVSLGSVESMSIEKPTPIRMIGPWAIALVMFGLVVGSLTLVYGIRAWKRAEVEYNSSLAEQTLNQAQATAQVTNTIVDLYTRCAEGTTDPNKRRECLSTASSAVARSLGALPQPVRPEKAWSFTEKIGLVAILVGGGYLGWKAWLKYKKQD